MAQERFVFSGIRSSSFIATVHSLVRWIAETFSFWRAELNCGAILVNEAGEGVAKKEVKLFSDVFQKRNSRAMIDAFLAKNPQEGFVAAIDRQLHHDKPGG